MEFTVDDLLNRTVLEAALGAAVLVLTAVAFIVLANAGFQQQGGLVTVAILLIILIAVNILSAIIDLRILENVR